MLNDEFQTHTQACSGNLLGVADQHVETLADRVTGGVIVLIGNRRYIGVVGVDRLRIEVAKPVTGIAGKPIVVVADRDADGTAVRIVAEERLIDCQRPRIAVVLAPGCAALKRHHREAKRTPTAL